LVSTWLRNRDIEAVNQTRRKNLIHLLGPHRGRENPVHARHRFQPSVVVQAENGNQNFKVDPLSAIGRIPWRQIAEAQVRSRFNQRGATMVHSIPEVLDCGGIARVEFMPQSYDGRTVV
jgi:hypothetical protein